MLSTHIDVRFMKVYNLKNPCLITAIRAKKCGSLFYCGQPKTLCVISLFDYLLHSVSHVKVDFLLKTVGKIQESSLVQIFFKNKAKHRTINQEIPVYRQLSVINLSDLNCVLAYRHSVFPLKEIFSSSALSKQKNKRQT